MLGYQTASELGNTKVYLENAKVYLCAVLAKVYLENANATMKSKEVFKKQQYLFDTFDVL